MLPAILVILAAYLIGGIPFGWLIAKSRGVDIFQAGSGNIGATNVGRVLGRKFGILVFLLDFAKGALPTWASLFLKDELAAFEDVAWLSGLDVAVGLAAFLGHLFPPYLRFRGGKGVATAAGVVSVLFPLAALGAFVTWAGVVAATRMVSLASLAAAAALLVLWFSLTPQPLSADNLPRSLFCLVAGGLVVVRHRSNLARIRQGTENGLPESTTMKRLARVVHVLALGLWFGSSAFFVVVALSLFQTFEDLGQLPADKRPAWLPLPEDFKKQDEHINGPKEQGSRLAGAAVAPLFGCFFLLQGVCGFLAVTTSLAWSRAFPQERVHRIRNAVLLLALVTVLIGWPLERKVSELRVPRNAATDAYLAGAGTEAERNTMVEARRTFFAWHTASLLLSFVTLGLVTWGMVLAARLPEERQDEVAKPKTNV